jgi:uncharacterized protein (TIGR00730 family)
MVNSMKELHFTKTNGSVDEDIDKLIKSVGEVDQPDLVREMILAALKAGQEKNDRAHMKLMNTTMKEMRFTGKMFEPYSNVRKVTVFGSARTEPTEPIYKLAKDFGRKLADSGYMVITGAGGGIMHAANEGAGVESSFGVNIQLPFEQKPNPVLAGNPKLITYKYFFNRKVAFLKEADAVALFPGGFGTLDEAMETLTLLQTGKHMPLPLVLIDEPGGTYWEHWINFFKKELLSGNYISECDFELFKRVNSIDEAFDVIHHFYSCYHSIRYVRNKVVIRLTAEKQPSAIEKLNEMFSDILIPGGKIVASDPLPEEEDEPEVSHLPRLVMDFNMMDFGKLKTLIDEINNC